MPCRESVVLIPFIDEDLMVSALAQLDHRHALSEEERARNVLGKEQTFWPAKASADGKGCVEVVVDVEV